MKYLLLLTLAATLALGGQLVNNGGFEVPVAVGSGPPTWLQDWGGVRQYIPSVVAGWQTTDTAIEIWNNSALPTQQSYEGSQFAEINAAVAGTLFQTVLPTAGAQLTFGFAHRGRDSATVGDVARVTIVDAVTGATVFTNTYSDTNTAWGYHTVNLGISNGDSLTIKFTAVSQSTGDVSRGNFIDAVSLNAVDPTPEPASMVLVGMGLAAAGLLRRKLQG